MIQVDDKIVSLDVFEKHFACDLQQCKGICCVEGDSGAPLLDEEKNIIEKNIEFIKTNMSSEGKKQLKKQGATIVDFEGDLTTPLVDGKECIYVTKENGINFSSSNSSVKKGETLLDTVDNILAMKVSKDRLDAVESSIH